MPVELADDSPVITVTPPEYARANEAVKVVNGLNELKALQYSEVASSFRFTRPAVAGRLPLDAEGQRPQRAASRGSSTWS